MKIKSFSVENFRSITSARKIPLENLTVLVGANNEGKSNILRALSLALRSLARLRGTMRQTSQGLVRATAVRPRLVDYDWDRDFPIDLQEKKTGSKTCKITLEFELDESEVAEFKEAIGSNLNSFLPITLEFRRDSIDFSINKPGRGSKTLNKAKNRIAEFVSRRIAIEYIPAIRTSTAAKKVVSNLVSDALYELYDDPVFELAISKIEELQQPVLDRLANSVESTVIEFLPNLKKVELRLEREDRYRALSRGVEVFIDDGSLTSLAGKGEGVQSLVALALMKDSARATQKGKRSRIIAIEEPESHLHPKAVHELREVIMDLAGDDQIVLTTHSPLFASTAHLEGMVIVENSEARPASSLADVRDCLGVRLSDNLQSAKLMIVVEGLEDKVALERLLRDLSPIIADSLEKGEAIIDVLGGASFLASRIGSHKASLSKIHALIDNDTEGVKAVTVSLDTKVLSDAEYNLTTIQSFSESEFEDYFDIEKYSKDFLDEFGVDLTIKPPGIKGKKWSTSTRIKFETSGKIWNDDVKMRAKYWLARRAAEKGKSLLHKSRTQSLIAFSKAVESSLTT